MNKTSNKSCNIQDVDVFVHDTHKKTKALINRITHSGDTDLDKDDLLKLKKICKASSDDLMLVVYKQSFKCLKKEHSQVRVAAVKLIDYLFCKSHIMRSKLLDDFDLFLELALAITQKTNVKLKLPPPKKYVDVLQELSAKAIHKWHADFGLGYEKLRYGYRYLKEHKLVDFNRFRVTNHEQLIKQQKLEEQQEKILSRSIENRLQEYRELKLEIEQLIAQIESIIDLLVPREDALIETKDIQDSSIQKQQHGIANLSQSIDIEFSPYVEIKKNVDNSDVITNLKELKKELINSKLVRLIAVEKTISKRSEKLVDTLKDIIDMKSRATKVVLKLGELKIVDDKDDEAGGDLESEEEDDFQDVEPKEDIESYIPRSKRYEYGLEPIDPKELLEESLVHLNNDAFGEDMLPSTSSETLKDSASRATQCNVPLESGKLCSRRDKVKCPFHGKIVPRDFLGIPINESDRLEELRLQAMKKKLKVPEWQDPQLLSDIKAATGVDLTMPSRGKLKKSPNKNLANIKTCDVTPKQRLQKKLNLLAK